MFRYYDITVTLDDARPPVWRRFLLAADVTFADLHRAIQDACGWGNYHLFDFSLPAGERIAGLPDPDWDDEAVPDAFTVALSSALVEQGVCRYVYDFGDHWEHTVRTEGIVESGERFHRRLLGGARAFPPEDCGGVPGYERCVEVARGGEDDEGLREWFGDWDPEGFDLEAARRAFDAAARPPGPASPFLRAGFPPPAEVIAVLAPTGPGGERPQTGDQLDALGCRARRAGFVKVRKGAVSATKRGAQLGRDPLADWQAAFHGLLDLGVLRFHYTNATWIDPYWKELVDDQVPGLLAHLLVTGQPVPLAELSDRLWQLVESSFVLDDLDAEQLRRHRGHLDHDVRSICQTFADLGAVEITDVQAVTTIYGHTQEHGGRAALTLLGAAAVQPLTRP